MICPECGFENIEESEVCTSCGCSMQGTTQTEEQFIWSELPPMPVLRTTVNESQDQDEPGNRRRLKRRTKRIIWQIALFSLEACILVGTVAGIFLWREKKFQPAPASNADNIVYSSDEIVMMLVQQKEKWILEKPQNGYHACCFLDLDYDGSPELISVAYDEDKAVTQMNAYRVRSCKLEKISVEFYKTEETAVFFDIGQQLSLYYAPDTKEMLYFTADMKLSGETITEAESENILGSFYMQENRIFQKQYFCCALNDGVYQYYCYDQNNTLTAISRQEYQQQQDELLKGLVNLRLRYEWITSRDDLSELSPQKLAALLLRSYDQFSYDTSGLSLQ